MIRFRVYEKMAQRGIKRRKQLAEMVGTVPSNIARVIDGNVKALSIDMLDRLCRALDCKPGDLLDYEPESEQTRLNV